MVINFLGLERQVFLFSLLVCVVFAGHGHDYQHNITNVTTLPSDCVHWEYKGKCGEGIWGLVAKACTEGTHQSPINIPVGKTKHDASLTPPVFYKGEGSEKHFVFNNGHTAIVHIESEYFVKDANLPGKYKIAQLHFHWGSDDFKGSEHTISGMSYPLEPLMVYGMASPERNGKADDMMAKFDVYGTGKLPKIVLHNWCTAFENVHIVTYNRDKYTNMKESISSGDENAVAVFASFAKISDTNEGTAIFDSVAKSLSQIKYANLTKPVYLEAFPPSDLTPKDHDKYYRYMGSFTTPPCSQIVIWTVFKNTLPISHEQLKEFRQLSFKSKDEAFDELVNNYRKLQPLSERTITRSFKIEPVEASYRQADSGAMFVPTMAVTAWATLVTISLTS